MVKEFRQLAAESLGEAVAEELLQSLEKGDNQAITSVRFNTAKANICINTDVFSQCVDNQRFEAQWLSDAEPVPWCKEAVYLRERINFTLDPLLHAGAYYVQDASSMFLSLLPRELWGSVHTALDLCAAPGGKATQLIQLLSGGDLQPNASFIVVNEPIKKRVPPLMDNLARWGAANVLLTSCYAGDITKACSQSRVSFDFILADVPCSGEGMFRKSEAAREGWSLAAVKECALRQRDIIKDIWPALKSGGILVYSTCTYNHFENADNVEFIQNELGADVLQISKEAEALVAGLLKITGASDNKAVMGYQFVAGRVRGEGQFFSVLRKRSNDNNQRVIASQQPVASQPLNLRVQKPDTERITSNNIAQRYKFVLKNNKVYALPIAQMPYFERFTKVLRPIMQGVEVGEVKGKDLIPSHDFALSLLMKELIDKGKQPSDFIPKITLQLLNGFGVDFFVVNICREPALKYLAKQTINPAELSKPGGLPLPTGFILLMYQGFPLGFVKNIGSRLNNLLPLQRRILQTI